MPAAAPSFLTRPVVELLGRHPGYGFAGVGVSTAIGNFTQTAADLLFPVGLLGLLDWQRTYNSHSGAIGALGPGWVTSLSASLVPPPPGTAGAVTFNDEDGRVLTFTPAADGGYTRPQDLAADLVRNQDGSLRLNYDSGAVWSFDATGRLTGRSLEGQQVSLDYNSDDQLLRASHSSGRSLAFAYTDSRRLASVTASDGRAVSFGYTAGSVTDALLETVTLPGGGVLTFEHSGSGQAAQVSKITDPDGNLIVANSYDASTSAVTSQQFPGDAGAAFQYGDTDGVTTVTAQPSAAVVSFRADPNGRLAGVTDPAGHSVTFSYDSQGYLAQAVTPLGTQLTQTHDAHGNLLSSTWGGATTSATYDSIGRPVTETDAVGGITGYGYTGSSHVPVRVTDPDHGVTAFTVTNGLITSRTDADGGVTGYSYDATGNLVSVMSATGEITSFGHDEAGRRTSVTAPSGRTTSYTYDTAGRVSSVTDGAGETTSYRYSAAGLLLAVTDATGAVTSYSYDAAGRRTGSTDALDRTIAFGYDPDGNLTSITDAVGEVTHASYDALGQLASVTDSADAQTRFSYDADGRQLAQQDPAGTTTFGWDARGNLISVSDHTDATFTFGYDLADRLTRVTGPDGSVTSTGYDAVGNPVSATGALGAVSRQEWTLGGKLALAIDALGRRTSYTYDATGRTETVTDPEGGVWRFSYNADGRTNSVTTPAGLTTSYRYDTAGRLVASVDPRGWVTRQEYSARGQRTAVISPSGAVTRWRYDPAGQLTEVIDPNESVTQLSYDNAGHLDAVTDAKGSVTRFGYDAAGRQVSSTDPLGRVTKREYDKSGRLVGVTDPDGQTVTITYDAAGRLTKRAGPDGSFAEYAYDKAGQRIQLTDQTGTTRYSYDAAGQLLSVTGPDGGVLTLSYDAAGQRVGLGYPDGLQVGYQFDLNGRLIGVQDSRAGDAVYALDPDGRLLTEQLPGRLARRYHYEHGLLHRFLAIRDDRPVAEATFTRDPDGRIRTQREGDRIREFRYDPAGQLVYDGPPEDGPEARDGLHLSYDVVGNRVAARRGPVELRYRYDAADQLLAVREGDRRTEFHYDSSGRLIREDAGPDRSRELRYDSFGFPVRVSCRRSEGQEEFDAAYNGDGLLVSLRRTARGRPDGREEASQVSYEWSAGGRVPQIISQRVQAHLDDAEARPGDRFDADFSYGYGRVFASREHERAVFHRDAFASALSTEDTEPWVAARDYSVFGTPEAQQPGPDRREPERREPERREPERREPERREPERREPERRDRDELAGHWPPRFGYRGELTLGSTIYLRRRLYDSDLGRFTSRDPVKVLTGPSQLANPYSYARNDPLGFIDPLGKLPFPLPPVGNPVTFFNAPVPGRGCDELCRRRMDTLTPHRKCFQGIACLGTRGYVFPKNALNHNLAALYSLIQRGQPERAAQAETIHQLDWDREGFIRSLFGGLTGTPISYNVDWEVRDPGFNPANRTDIITDAEGLFEVKAYQGEQRTRLIVQAQLGDYIAHFLFQYGVVFEPSSELNGWGEALSFATYFTGPMAAGLGGFLGGETIMYIWGLGNPDGHIYFSLNEGDVPEKVRLSVTVPPPAIFAPGGSQQEPVPEPVPEPLPEPEPVPGGVGVGEPVFV